METFGKDDGADEALEEEVEDVRAGRRMDRAMRKEGIEKQPVRVERVARVRRQVDPGAFVRE